MKYKINQKIWHIQINNAVDEKSYRPNGVTINELIVIGISQYKICLNDDWFTTLDLVREGGRKDRSVYSYLDDVHTGIRTGDNILGDGVFVTLYSTKKPTSKLLEKMVASAAITIDKEFGFLLGGVKDNLYDFVDNYKL